MGKYTKNEAIWKSNFSVLKVFHIKYKAYFLIGLFDDVKNIKS